MEQADLSKPETIPATLVGVHTVIDCATGRPEEPIKKVSFCVVVVSFVRTRGKHGFDHRERYSCIQYYGILPLSSIFSATSCML